MQITIDIPEEFVSHYKGDKFGDSLQRLKSDAHLLAGNYEKELVDMLIKAFKNAKEYDTPKLFTPLHPRWKPEMGSRYFLVTPCSDDTVSTTSWDDEKFDKNEYKLGNVFSTKVEAEFASERLKVLAEMREWAGRWNADYAIFYNSSLVELSVCSIFYCNITTGEMRFATLEDAKNCIKAVGEERLKKYYFRVPDDE